MDLQQSIKLKQQQICKTQRELTDNVSSLFLKKSIYMDGEKRVRREKNGHV